MKHVFGGVVAAFAVAATIGVFAQVPALDVKMGLWEITTTFEMNGPPPIDTSQMSPEQKARMEAAMKQMMGPHTSTDKKCLKKEDMSKDFMKDEAGGNCKNTVVSNTATVYEVKRECTGDRTETTVVHMEAAGPETVKGQITASVVKGGKEQKINATFSGKFQAANCGDVK